MRNPFIKEEQLTGFVPNLEQDKDPRNVLYEDIAPFAGQTIPESGDVEKEPWTLNQGKSSSCTCQSTVNAYYQATGKKLSPRYAFHKIKTDPKYPSSQIGFGAYMVDSLNLLCKDGIDVFSDEDIQNAKSDDDYINYTPSTSALKNKGGLYIYTTSGADDLEKFDSIVRFMAEQKHPVKVGMQWRGSFNNARKTGIVPTEPATGSIAGHDMMAVAWKKINGHEYIGFRNSFSHSWGDKGRIWLPKGFFKIQTGIAYFPPQTASEVKTEALSLIPKDYDRHLAKSKTAELRKLIYTNFPLDVAKGSQDANYAARSLAGKNWLTLWTAVCFRGWSIIDISNWLYAQSRNKTKEKAYNFDFLKTK